MTGEELAARMSRTKTFIYRLESEETEPTIEQMNQLVSLLPISMESLLIGLGLKLSPPLASKLPAPLINKLLALSPERLQALTVMLPDPER